MPPEVHHSGAEPAILPTLKRFLPYLWPKDSPGLRGRLALSGLLVLLAKGGALLVPFAYKAVVDRMSGDTPGALGIILLLVGAYILARFAGVAFDSLRRVAFERVGQTATHRLASRTFEHLHKLSLRYHLSRRTGEVTKVVERGTKTIDTMIYFLLFNIAPTVVELVVVLVVFYMKLGIGSVLATVFMVWLYIFFTRKVTDWRNHLRQEMNDLDTRAIGRSVDSLLNYETVKYFGAEDRETARYSHAVQTYARAAEKSENSLGFLNIGQAFITNAMMLGAMLYTVWLWDSGDLTVGDLVLVNGLLMQLFRPLDLLGFVYRTIRQGMVDMAQMFDLMDTAVEVADRPGAPALVTLMLDRRKMDGNRARGPCCEPLTSVRVVFRLEVDVRPPARWPRSICTGPPPATTGSARGTTTGSSAATAVCIACMPLRQICRPTPGGATATALPWPAPAWAVSPTPGPNHQRRRSCTASAWKWRPSPAAGAGRLPTSRSNR